MRANRLIGEKSPYLLQHAHNPVDWHPWGQDAFAEARRRDAPVFLSIGYSTCHWCHVMERESFEREDVAALLREHFVAIKVDREERPDLDDLYMPATQMLTGRGGWPNSLWLTPDGRPWYAGTYFPPEDRGGMPGFKRVLRALAQAWRERRGEIETQAESLAEALRANAAGAARRGGEPTREWAERVIAGLRSEFDAAHGGFGGAPKFPPHTALRLLLEEFRRGRDAGLTPLISGTLDAMALGGIRDHVGGGFHRYSTDAKWFLPHFEKMLYDNALLIRAYASAFALTGRGLYRAAAEEACEWALREMTHAEGGFYSALDADSEGEEGRFYLWTRGEIVETLGEARGEAFCRAYGVTVEGNYRPEHGAGEAGRNILFRAADDDGEAFESERAALLSRRARRVRPHCDDKVLTDWNGLMIGAMAVAGGALGEARYVRAAERAAGFVLSRSRVGRRLAHRWREGEARGEGMLDDYAFLADGLLDLRATTGAERWLTEARTLAGKMLELFSDLKGGALFQTAGDSEKLFARMKPTHDMATPSGNGVAARVLARLGEATGEEELLRAASGVLSGLSETVRQVPQLGCTAAGAAGQLAALRESRVEACAVRLVAGAEVMRARGGERIEVSLELRLPSGYHVGLPADGQASGLPMTASLPADVTLESVAFPEAEEIEVGRTRVKGYRGSVAIRARLQVAGDAPAGERWLQFAVEAQPCTEHECMAKRVLRAECRLRIGE